MQVIILFEIIFSEEFFIVDSIEKILKRIGQIPF